MRIEFVVHGPPFGKQRPQFSTYGGRITTRTPQKTVVYENLVRMEFQNQCNGKRFSDEAMLKVKIDAYYAIPQSASKMMKSAMQVGSLRPKKKPDCDNVVKSILDSLNGIAYRDDAQVVDVEVHKWYDDVPCVRVNIEEITLNSS